MVSEDLLAATRPLHPPVTTLGALAQWLAGSGFGVRPAVAPSTRVTGITLSSQRVLPGDLYVALPGSRAHGAAFAAAAIDAGAVAVLTDAEGADLVPSAVPAAGGGPAPRGAGPARRPPVRRPRRGICG